MFPFQTTGASFHTINVSKCWTEKRDLKLNIKHLLTDKTKSNKFTLKSQCGCYKSS